jgi:hypothetical protein
MKISAGRDQAVVAHLNVGFAAPVGWIGLWDSENAGFYESSHEFFTPSASLLEFLVSGWPLVGFHDPRLEIFKMSCSICYMIEDQRHVGSPYDSADIDNVPALLSVVPVDDSHVVVFRAVVVEEVVASVGITVDHSVAFASDWDRRNWVNRALPTIGFGVPSWHVSIHLWVSLRKGNCLSAVLSPPLTIGLHGSLVHDPSPWCVRPQCFRLDSTGEQRHSDLEVLALLYTRLNEVGDLALLSNEVEENFVVHGLIEGNLVVVHRFHNNFFASKHSGVHMTVTTSDHGHVSGAWPVLIKHCLGALLIVSVIANHGLGGFLVGAELREVIDPFVDLIELIWGHHWHLNGRVHSGLNESGCVAHDDTLMKLIIIKKFVNIQ